MEKLTPTFIVDCHVCKAKVAALQKGIIEKLYYDEETSTPDGGERVMLGECPCCHCTLVGESLQIGMGGEYGDDVLWSDVIRVYPQPPKAFSSNRIPKVVSDSISEATKSLQANANIAACVMFGRALEAICRDLLEPATAIPVKPPQSPSPLPAAAKVPVSAPLQRSASKKPIMLGEGIRRLKDKGLIDQRLFDWSQQLQAFRNLAAHPTDISISRQDADDLKSFVCAIIEYVYDLTDKYNEFTARAAKKKK